VYGNITLPVILCGFETWYVTLREEYRLRVFENGVLRRIIESKREEIQGGWRKSHNKAIHVFYFSPTIIRLSSKGGIYAGGTYGTCGGEKKCMQSLVWKP
jgi:hypothetical protein